MKTVKAKEHGVKVLSFDLVGDVEYLDKKVEEGQGEERRGWVVPGDFLTAVPLPGDAGGRPLPSTSTSNGQPSANTSKKRKRNRKSAGGAGEDAGEELEESQGPEMVDVVVCCLSLMGTNWVGGVYEACRVLKKG